MDGSVCDTCHQPAEWCVCDDPVEGEAAEDVILDIPEGDLEDLDFSDRLREMEAHTFEDDFDRELPELEPSPDELDLLADEELQELEAQERMLNEGAHAGWDDDDL